MENHSSQSEQNSSKSGASKGGTARAKKLDPQKRREIAQKAAASRWNKKNIDSLPKADEYRGQLIIGEQSLPCAVLDNGQRVLSETGIAEALGGRTGSLRRAKKASEDAGEPLPVFLASKSLLPFFDEDLIPNSLAVIEYTVGNRIEKGYAAQALPEICNVWLKARAAGALSEKMLHRAQAAEILVRGLAEVGIIALIDEATGYQKTREKEALQKILDIYLKKEFATWAKRFPDEFYREIFRLRKWDWKGMKVNRPSVVGKYTNDIVYERLAPGVLEELQTLNPKNDEGIRKARHHQFLTENVGHPALAQHLHTVIGFMRASSSWNQFKSLLDRAFPKGDVQLSLLLEEEDYLE
ncbi:MAG: hypothetical protein EAZ61_13120 [Oscillatoriales cyanobacterium]|nr:MAG: hypothetical protein EAZ61_13120 [Oscillatoriales cyanobacterium]